MSPSPETGQACSGLAAPRDPQVRLPCGQASAPAAVAVVLRTPLPAGSSGCTSGVALLSFSVQTRGTLNVPSSEKAGGASVRAASAGRGGSRVLMGSAAVQLLRKVNKSATRGWIGVRTDATKGQVMARRSQGHCRVNPRVLCRVERRPLVSSRLSGLVPHPASAVPRERPSSARGRRRQPSFGPTAPNTCCVFVAVRASSDWMRARRT
jgi:hypothetical protein